ncbi:hypothetical protein Tco_0521471, partial [Tanacetum coccineum]
MAIGGCGGDGGGVDGGGIWSDGVVMVCGCHDMGVE